MNNANDSHRRKKRKKRRKKEEKGRGKKLMSQKLKENENLKKTKV